MRDTNEPAIVKALKAVGASVTPLNGTGVPDLLVGFRGQTYLLEVKLPLGKKGGTGHGGGASKKGAGGDGVLTESQLKWWRGWCGKFPKIVRSPEEALAVIGADAAGQERWLEECAKLRTICEAVYGSNPGPSPVDELIALLRSSDTTADEPGTVPSLDRTEGKT